MLIGALLALGWARQVAGWVTRLVWIASRATDEGAPNKRYRRLFNATGPNPSQ
jgi:hypothetical protein